KPPLLFTIQEQCIKQPHTYLPPTILIQTTQNLLNQHIHKPIQTHQLLQIIHLLSQHKKLISQPDHVSIPTLYYS
ncbi:hypothetical protein, partial [Staphylococcus epidermidis]|uniref:hypothetical protein n=1 Tax=Staphylococcus epidermidis TaxID=1282 RepID=UPI0011AA71BB